jgi:hypothetical protein
MKWSRLLPCLLFSALAIGQTHSPATSVGTASAGPAACARCHTQGNRQPATSMGNALETVEQCKVLIDHPVLATRVGKYSYRIERKGSESEYSVSDGAATLKMPVRWAMGASSAIGQTYILEKDGELYESRVSYFRELGGLGPTLGSAGSEPADIQEAAGRRMSHDDKLRCFGCHSTNAAAGRQLTLEKLSPGVNCWHCHDGVDTHLAAALLDSYDLQVPKELSKLHGMSAEQTANFCGQCHRTWAEIAAQPNPGIANVRFQPYRLTGSKCYDPDDARISCLACHDPHKEVTTSSADYDSKCMECHGGGKVGAKKCPVAKDKCATCHMPKLELPGAHFKFSDHRIRVVKPGEPYPG